MVDERTSARDLRSLRNDLSKRDLAIIERVAELHLMSAQQLAVLHFPSSEHASPLSSARAGRRVLERLTRDRLLVRLDRRLGGVRGGSGSYIYGLGPVGHRLLELDRARPRYYREPSRTFTEHTLAIGDVVVAITAAARAGRCELLSYSPEPSCWRTFSSLAGRAILKPDLFLALGVGDFEDRFFIEVDRGTEHLPAILRKCHTYDAYYLTGREQAEHGVFPKVCLIAPDATRADRLAMSIVHDRQLEPSLFMVTTTGDSLTALLKGGST